MSGRVWLVVLLAIAAAGWWFSPVSPRPARAPALAEGVLAEGTAAGATPGCTLPPRLLAPGEPLQSPAPASMAPFRLQPATLTPLAGFSVDARVLSRRDYASGREAELSPTDLALGWGRMRDDDVLSRLEISQSGRWYHYRWQDDAPIPPDEILRSSANMHLIPASDRVALDLRNVRAGQRVRVDGWLVEAVAADGWRWRSSTTRADTGAGGCEVIYVCAITRL